MQTGDTIAAVSTPPGEGALALIRISGPDSLGILDRVFRKKGTNLTPRRATCGEIVEGDAVVDQVLTTVFRAPASHTGEDMAEIGCHGGILLAAHVLELVLKAGARAAAQMKSALALKVASEVRQNLAALAATPNQ